MKKYTNEQSKLLSYSKKEVKIKNTINYVLSENPAKRNTVELAEKDIYRYPFHKKVLAYELELF